MTQLLRNGEERARYGCTVTFENGNGDLWTLTRPGPPLKALKALCAIAPARDDTYRLVCYSSPETVYGDIKGRMPTPGNETVELLESTMLSRIGLLPLLHPRLALASDGKLNERHLRARTARRKA